ncbi:MAG: ABC transporter ATP-binding protein [Phycisphaerae bacterium]
MIRIDRVQKSFGKTRAVDDLSFEIAPGEIFGLLGPNGAGKTTTVSICCGLIAPDRGAVAYDGLGCPADARVRTALGVAPQSLALYDELSGEENAAFFGGLFGLRGERLKQRVKAALEFVGLYDRRRDLTRTYSGGMKRRLNLAVALVHEPRVLFLDEPTVGVDPQSRNAIFESIRRLREQGCTILYTTHYMEEAEKLCDRVGIMDRGKLLALDRVPALLARHGGRSVVLAETHRGETRVETDDPLAELSRLQAAGGLTRFRVESPDLEAVFLHLTGRTLRD